MNVIALREEDLPHYTYDDYVKWEGRWEIIHGIAYAMVPAPVIKHQRLSKNIIWQLEELLQDCNKCEVLLPVDWQITEDTVVQPDVLVVCSESGNIGVEKLEITPVLVFEVLSKSTSRKDKIIKYQLYENAGVKYYCIVDPDSDSADIFVLHKNKYRQDKEPSDGCIVLDLCACHIKLDFRKIFR